MSAALWAGEARRPGGRRARHGRSWGRRGQTPGPLSDSLWARRGERLGQSVPAGRRPAGAGRGSGGAPGTCSGRARASLSPVFPEGPTGALLPRVLALPAGPRVRARVGELPWLFQASAPGVSGCPASGPLALPGRSPLYPRDWTGGGPLHGGRPPAPVALGQRISPGKQAAARCAWPSLDVSMVTRAGSVLP